jgi:DNA repair exonuclease SbcCD ATPase subunit
VLLTRPLKIRIANFGPFRREEEFSFAGHPGLYYLTGENRVEPELGANGCGKSRLWDALYWCCFGLTVRGLRASDVANWTAESNTRVETDFACDGDIFTLRRGWNPNALQLRKGLKEDGLFHDVTQEEVHNYVMVGAVPFLHSVIIPQMTDDGKPGACFLDLSPTDKANLISSVLNLDQWIQLADAAQQRTKLLDSSIRTLEVRAGELRGRLVEIKSIDLTAKINEWHEQFVERVKTLSDRFEAVLREKKEAEEQIAARDTKVKSLKLTRTEITSQLVEQKNRATDLRRLASSDQATIARHDSNAQNYAERRKYFNDHDQCVACNQVIPVDHRDEQLAMINSMIQTADDQASKVRTHMQQMLADADHCQREYERLQGDSTDIGQEIATHEADLRHFQGVLVQIQTAVERMNTEIEQLEKEENPYEKEEVERQSKLRSVQRDLLRADLDIEQKQKEQNATGYWVKGFRMLRLQMISEALLQLEVEVNNMLEQLGLHDWRVEFDVDSITKAGTVRRGFSVMIHSPYNQRPVPWEAWSGGESQRLRLAATMGLANLILNHLGVESSIEIWDEPSNYLSSSGIDDLLALLKQRAVRLSKEIWLVDHRTFDAGGFTKVVTAVKDSNGSFFVQ